jgi:DNA-binding NarL/FixJ family response regulator
MITDPAERNPGPESNAGATVEQPITVVIVEDDAEIRGALTRAIEKEPHLRLLQSFPTAEAALSAMENLAPHVVVMDIRLPGMDGIECTRRLKACMPAVQVLVFTVFMDGDLIFRALAAGASGYLLKRTSRREIVDAIEQVWSGGAPMSAEIARRVVESFRAPPMAKTAGAEKLTPREEEVLTLLAAGLGTKEIADQMTLSFDTIKFHLKKIYAKLHVRSRTEAVIKFLR